MSSIENFFFGMIHYFLQTNTGVQYNHTDLAQNYVANFSLNLVGNISDDPYPDLEFDEHGTSCAGVAAAVSNDVCGVGVAPLANFSGIRLLGSQPSTDANEAEALSYMNQNNLIYSNSWGPIDDGLRLEGPGTLTEAAILQSVQNGRNGSGSIYVWAAGFVFPQFFV